LRKLSLGVEMKNKMKGKKIECMVIDDDRDDQEIFQLCVDRLEKDIYCTLCDNGVEALSYLSINENYIPGYIFLDVNMPKMNGIDCLKELRRIDRLNGTIIFMYSTTSESSTLAEALKSGAKDFIIKPAKTADLVKRLSSIF
jgi:DNA-binding response OmpR family regulator